MLFKKSDLFTFLKNDDTEELAQYYFENGTFEEISIQEETRGRGYIVEGVFRARYYKNKMKIKVDDRYNITNAQCDCFSTGNRCAHIGALMLKVAEIPERTMLPYYVSSKKDTFEQRKMEQVRRAQLHDLVVGQSLSEDLIKQFKSRFEEELRMLTQSDLAKIQLVMGEEEYGYRRGMPVATFKVGFDKSYIVKDIRKFLGYFVNHETVRYGKTMTLKHSYEYFDDVSLKIIAFMQRNESVDTDVYGKYKDILLATCYDDFYSTFSELPWEYTKLRFHEELGRISLTVEEIIHEGRLFYKIDCDTNFDLDTLSSKHAYEFTTGQVTKFQLDEDGKSMQLLMSFTHDRKIVLSHEQMNEFYKYVLSDLDIYVDFEDLMPYISMPEVANIQVFADITDEGMISITMNYEEGGKKCFAFQERNTPISIEVERVETLIRSFADAIDEEASRALIDINHESAYVFAQEGIQRLMKMCEVFVSEALQGFGKSKTIQMSVGVAFEHDLLSIEIDSLDIDKSEIANVLSSYRRKKKFHRLKDGQLLSLNSNELSELDDLFQQLHISASELKDGKMNVPTYRSFMVDQIAKGSKHVDFTRTQRFRDFMSNFKKNNDFEIHDKYMPILRDYQQQGVQWLGKMSHYQFGGILADDMGLGKTLQMISFLESQPNDKPHLVVCPASLLLNWNDEIMKFDSGLRTLCLNGSVQARAELISQIPQYDLVITSYDYLRRDIDELERFEFATVILDEAQYIKNQKTKNAHCVKRINAKNHFALTGTPIENSLAELWSIFDFLMPGYLYSYHYFLNNFEKPIVKENDQNAQTQLKRLVEPFILRRNKQEVLKELPDKIENTYMMNFSEDEQKLYLANLSQINQSLQEMLNVEAPDRIQVLAMLTRLRQICCEPRMVYENIHHASSKLRGCMELIEALARSKKKILLFSSFTSALDLIAEELRKHSISYVMLTGSTEKLKRKQLVDQFQSDDTTVFLISLKAGGTGLNLTAAQAVIHYDPWWNLSAQNQATDRAYRIGQENNVQVFKLIMKDSIEEKIQDLQRIKQGLSDVFVENSSGSITTMSMNEIIDLLQIKI